MLVAVATSKALLALVVAAALCESKVLFHNPGHRQSGLTKAHSQSLDSHFWTHEGTKTYDNHQGRFF